MPMSRDSSIVKLQFKSRVNVTSPQVFSLLKNSGANIKEVEMLQELVARNSYGLKFKSDARWKVCLA